MIAFSCALYNIITGRHFVKYWVPGGGGVCQSGEVETVHNILTSCEAYSSLRENFLNYLECDPTNEADINEHSLPVEIMKSTDNETVITYQNLSLYALRRDLNALNADSQ